MKSLKILCLGLFLSSFALAGIPLGTITVTLKGTCKRALQTSKTNFKEALKAKELVFSLIASDIDAVATFSGEGTIAVVSSMIPPMPIKSNQVAGMDLEGRSTFRVEQGADGKLYVSQDLKVSNDFKFGENEQKITGESKSLEVIRFKKGTKKDFLAGKTVRFELIPLDLSAVKEKGQEYASMAEQFKTLMSGAMPIGEVKTSEVKITEKPSGKKFFTLKENGVLEGDPYEMEVTMSFTMEAEIPGLEDVKSIEDLDPPPTE